MQQDSSRLFGEKAELIFEFDNSSPLFTRKANKLIELNNIEEAIRTLETGLQLFPDYPTAFVLLGRCLSLIGDYEKSIHNYKIAASLIDSEDSLIAFYAEVELLQKMRSPFTLSKKSTSVEEDLHLNFDGDENKTIAKNDDLLDLARKISGARIEVVEEDIPETDSDLEEEPLIISETLAKIYTSQEKYQEAISVYRLLIQKYPSKQNYFEEIISGLQNRLNS